MYHIRWEAPNVPINRGYTFICDDEDDDDPIWWPQNICFVYIIGECKYMCTRALRYTRTHSKHMAERFSTVQFSTQTHVGLLTFRLERWHMTMKRRNSNTCCFLYNSRTHTQTRKQNTKPKRPHRYMNEGKNTEAQNVLWYLNVDPEWKSQYMQSKTTIIMNNIAFALRVAWAVLLIVHLFVSDFAICLLNFIVCKYFLWWFGALETSKF